MCMPVPDCHLEALAHHHPRHWPTTTRGTGPPLPKALAHHYPRHWPTTTQGTGPPPPEATGHHPRHWPTTTRSTRPPQTSCSVVGLHEDKGLLLWSGRRVKKLGLPQANRDGGYWRWILYQGLHRAGGRLGTHLHHSSFQLPFDNDYSTTANWLLPGCSLGFMNCRWLP